MIATLPSTAFQECIERLDILEFALNESSGWQPSHYLKPGDESWAMIHPVVRSFAGGQVRASWGNIVAFSRAAGADRAKKLIDALEEGPIPAEGELSKVLATVPTWSQLRREWLDIKHQSRKEGREWPWFKVAYLSEAFGLVANEGFEPW